MLAAAALVIDGCRGRTAGKTMADVLAASKPSDWRTLDPENTLYMELAGGRVVIELAPEFAPSTSPTSARWCAASTSTVCRSCARRTTSSCSGAIRPMPTRRSRWARPRRSCRRSSIAARRVAVHRAAGSGHVCAADGLRLRISRRARQGGWHGVARALLQHGRRRSRQRRRTAAAALRSTWFQGMRRASSIATSRCSGVSCTAWSCWP